MVSYKNQISPDIIFNELIIPQGMIIAKKDKKKFVAKANNAFKKVAGIKTDSSLLPINTAFKFLNNFNENVIKQYFLSTKTDKTQFIYRSGKFKYKLQLKKIDSEILLFSLEDITTQHSVQAELNEQKRILSELQQIAKSGFWIEHYNFHNNFWSEQIYKILNIKKEEIIPSFSNYLSFVSDKEKQKVKNSFQDSVKNKTGFEIKHSLRLKNGTVKYVILKSYTNYDSSGNPIQSVGIIQDITASEIIKIELQNSESIFRSVFQYAPLAVILINKDRKPLLCNNHFCEITGYTTDEILKRGLKDFTHPDDIERNIKIYNRLLNNEIDHFSIKKRIIRKNSSVIWVNVTVSAIKDKSGNVESAIAMVQDISKQVFAEEQKEEYRLFLETIMDNLPIALFAKTTPDFKYLYWNKTLEETTKIISDEAIGHTDFEIQKFKKSYEKFLAEDQKVLKTGKKIKVQHEFINPLGELKYFETIKVLHKPHTGNPIILGISMDITHIKDVERKIEQSTQMLKEAQRIAQLGYWEYNIDKDLFFDNKENRQIMGIEKFPYFINYNQFIDLLHPDDRKIAALEFKKCIVKKTAGEGIIKTVSKNGVKHIAVSYIPVKNEKGKVVKLRGTCLDITSIKNKEYELQKLTNRLIDIQNIANIGFIEIDNNNCLFSNTLKNIIEVPIDNTEYKSGYYNSLIHPDDKKTIIKTFEKAIKIKRPYKIQYRLKLKSGIIKYVNEILTINKTDTKNNLHITRIIQDITELKKQEIEYNKITETQPEELMGTWEYNLSNGSLSINKKLHRFIKTNDISDKNKLYELIHPDDRFSVINIIKKSFEIKENFLLSYRIVTQDNKTYYIQNMFNFHAISTGEQIVYGVVKNITKYKKHIEDLQNKAAFFTYMADNSLVGIVIYQDKKRIFSNKKWAHMLGVEPKELNNMRIDEIYKPETAKFLNRLFADWDAFKIKEYSNRITLHPVKTEPFVVEISIKEIILNNKRGFVLLAYPEQ
jgi:PAS domain S-box-containing protein